MPLRRAARAVIRRAGPVARRDARITELRATVAAQRAELTELRRRGAGATRRKNREFVVDPTKPSFYLKIEESKRHWADRTSEPPDPIRALLSKQLCYALARSHGVATPEVFGTWDDPEAITWDELPDTFVLKTNRGAASRGVFPCRRDGDLLRVAGTDAPVHPDELVERITRIRNAGKVMYPVFAEEWLRTPSTEPPELPVDIKIDTFFGAVGLIRLRTVPKHGHGVPTMVRYLSRTGEDLGNISEDRQVSTDIPVPDDLDGLVEVAERLSAATRTPFIRVDLYETTRGIVFGEFTPIPGHRLYLSGGLDVQLGELWEDAQRRLMREVRRTGVLDLSYGPHPQA